MLKLAASTEEDFQQAIALGLLPGEPSGVHTSTGVSLAQIKCYVLGETYLIDESKTLNGLPANAMHAPLRSGGLSKSGAVKRINQVTKEGDSP